jgi:hypothetical protein
VSAATAAVLACMPVTALAAAMTTSYSDRADVALAVLLHEWYRMAKHGHAASACRNNLVW